MSRMPHQRGGPRRACHPPTDRQSSTLAAHTPMHCIRAPLTCGTFSLSVCDEAASVVTLLKAGRVAMGVATLRRRGEAMLRLNVRDNMAIPVWR
jgi:hypothetical protein